MSEEPKKQPASIPAEKNRKENRRSSGSREVPQTPGVSRKKTKPTSAPTAAKKAGGDVYPLPETVGGHEPTGNNRRRRHKNHISNGAGISTDSPTALTPPPGVSADDLIRRAWKIYLGEVTEEGLALMDDSTAEETAKKAFRIAEIFLTRAAAYRGK